MAYYLNYDLDRKVVVIEVILVELLLLGRENCFVVGFRCGSGNLIPADRVIVMP